MVRVASSDDLLADGTNFCSAWCIYRGVVSLKALEKFPYRNVLVLGLAKSGTAAAKLLLEAGKKVRVNDKQVADKALLHELQSLGAEMITGSHPLSVLDDVEVIIKNPGIPYDNPVLAEAAKRDIPILTEIELAGILAGNVIIGITGSNGKTTTTTLIANMLNQGDRSAKVAGNIGAVATEVAQTLEEDEQLVLELSSFQLMGVPTFKPRIAVLLNIFEAHLDYHKTFENYRQAKCNIFANQTADDHLIYNADDPVVQRSVTAANSIKIPFSVTERLENGAWADETGIYFADEKIMDKADIVLVGKHNVENILAAVCAAKLSGATNEAIRQVLMTFSGVKHRLQHVATVKGRMFYNDSKATNMLATQKALSAFSNPVILLAGGLDRGNEFDDLKPYLRDVKGIVLFGETKEKLRRVAVEAEVPSIQVADNMDEAVKLAYGLSERKDVILLSPACASWDQYRTFEERGDMFERAVHTLM
ncbi:UDP-N-acetylmuramoyl-L-alanine--D-glutamate ligase [Lentibacillus cibarius]|uniref:UDP-N-acetylmuramoylalanine--D-glutamate ligase n=1 Tax=Lentibacillus cibarius TaxID=2583219 RepID=A0A5S3QNH4_9BACI|nr:UDP-N-acetylmuramoyl-L-alanine--D-glutamate ligase [Lentibacillus cibarius]